MKLNSDTGRNVIACEMVETSIFIGDILLWCVNRDTRGKETNQRWKKREKERENVAKMIVCTYE